MAQFHHVNLGVPPEEIDAEIDFLVSVLELRKVELTDELSNLGARWYETEDGSQVHLSIDPEHQPASRAHVAITYGSSLPGVTERLREQKIDFDGPSTGRPGFPPCVFCRDPAGNRWELRGNLEPA